MTWNRTGGIGIGHRRVTCIAGDGDDARMPLIRWDVCREQGMSLVELLVVASVLALLLLMTDRVFISVNLASQATQRATDLQHNARVAALRLRRELRESGAAAIACHPDPSCLTPSAQVVFPSARPSDAASVFCLDVASGDQRRRALESACSTPLPLTGTYAPVWQRYIGYHLDGGGGLRRVVQNTPIALPMPPTSGQVLAAHVAVFAVTREEQRLRFHIRSLDQDRSGFGGSPVQEMQLDDTVNLYNAVAIASA